jgi:hypothetical protein
VFAGWGMSAMYLLGHPTGLRPAAVSW